MSYNAWTEWNECAINEQGRGCYQHSPTSKANEPEQEVTHMPFEHDYGDSATNFKTEQYVNGGAA